MVVVTFAVKDVINWKQFWVNLKLSGGICQQFQLIWSHDIVMTGVSTIYKQKVTPCTHLHRRRGPSFRRKCPRCRDFHHNACQQTMQRRWRPKPQDDCYSHQPTTVWRWNPQPPTPASHRFTNWPRRAQRQAGQYQRWTRWQELRAPGFPVERTTRALTWACFDTTWGCRRWAVVIISPDICWTSSNHLQPVISAGLVHHWQPYVGFCFKNIVSLRMHWWLLLH